MGGLNQTVGWDSRWEWDRIPMGDLSLLLFVSMGGVWDSVLRLQQGNLQ